MIDTKNTLQKKLGGKNTKANAYAAKAIAKTVSSKNPSKLQKALYTANVVRIAKKDNSKNRTPLKINEKDSRETKVAKTDYNNMSDLEFRAKYKTSKDKYAKRVENSKHDLYRKGLAKASIATLINSNNPAIGKRKAASILAADITSAKVDVGKAYVKGGIYNTVKKRK